MIEVNYYIDNKKVNEPMNAPELQAQLNYGKDQFPNTGTINIVDFIWVREEYELLLSYIGAGKINTGVGITEGPAFRISASDGTITEDVFVGFLDFTNIKVKDRISITCRAVSHATVDWVNAQTSGFTMEYLASPEFKATGLPGYIDNTFYRWIPYTNNSVPNYQQAAIATLTVFAVTQAIYKEIEEIQNLIVEAGGVFTSVPAALKMIVKIAYLILLLATLIKLIEDTIKFLVTPVKYHAGMYCRDIEERCGAYLNMKIVFDVHAPGSIYYNEFILPPKFFNAPNKADKSILGYLIPDKNEQVGYLRWTFKDYLDAMKVKYNAKIVVTIPLGGATPTNQGTITIARRDKNVLPPEYVLPDTYIANSEWGFNIDELNANYLLQYQIDPQDMNTEQNYQGTIFQVICSQKQVNYQPFVQIRGLDPENIPFARISRKKELNTQELIIRDLLIVFDVIDNLLISIVNAMISVVNAITGFVNKIAKALKAVGIKVNWKIPAIPKLKKVKMSAIIDNRVGMAMLSNDHFNIAKIFVLNEGSQPRLNKIHPDNDTLESGKAMWDGFHYVNSMIPGSLNLAYADRPYGNQYKLQEFQNIPFTWSDFLKVVRNNRCFASDGTTPAIIESLVFYPPIEQGSSGKADVKVRISYIWTLNLQETFLNPDGR